MMSSPRAALAGLLLALAVLPGCLTSSELQCTAGLSKCADTCVATQTDSKNCGSCGSACNGGNVCVNGGCVCPVGQQVCNGVCTAIATDPRNCGSCGFVCATKPDGGSDQACNQGVCQDCGAGGCRTALVAGCIAGPGGGYLQQVHDLPDGLLLDSPANPSGASFPDALGVLGSVLLYADHDSSSLFEIPIGSLGTASASQPPLIGSVSGSKAGTTQLLVVPVDGGTLLYATTSSVNAIRTFGGPSPVNAGPLLANGSGSLGLVIAGGVGFDAGSFPEPFAAIGSEIFVPLNGTGQVVRINVANPASAQFLATYDLAPLVAALPGGGVAADGGPFIASPTQAIARNGYVYVAANVLRYYADFSGADYGPPLVARIDPNASGAAAVTALGGFADAGIFDGGVPCQNVEWLANLPLGAVATPMLVSCAGARAYDKDYNVTSVTNTALVLLDAKDQPIGFWVPRALPPARPPSVGRAVPQNTTVYVADETAGRLYVVDYTTNGFVERVGSRNGFTAPVVCPSYITDLTVVPAP